MSTEFVLTREMKPIDVHAGICENMSKMLFGTGEEAAEAEKPKFTEGYRAALKAGIIKLATFVMEQGRPLVGSDPNSSLLSY